MICRIEVEGLDRTGKDTLVGYLDYMSNRLMPVSSRGLLSTLAYADIYGRWLPMEKIDKMCEGNKETLVVMLTADLEDLKIRHQINHHPAIDIMRDYKAFNRWRDFIQSRGVTVLEYNTTYMTPYEIAKNVLKFILEEDNK